MSWAVGLVRGCTWAEEIKLWEEVLFVIVPCERARDNTSTRAAFQSAAFHKEEKRVGKSLS